jgi:O-antigen ligase
VYASYEYRYALKDAAIAALSRDLSRATWGFGLESFYSLQLKGNFGGKEHVFLSCDSVWIGILLETGYVGLLFFVMMLATPAIAAFRDYRKLPRPDRYLSLLLLTNLVMYYFMMTSVAMYSWGQPGFMLWVIIAASLAYGRLKKSERYGANIAALHKARDGMPVPTAPTLTPLVNY